ncbi:hypothetical protein JZ751_020041 [Albula glossodonta]|uniref:Uncharacterized protein n=1 Tax=Albula glossodonta TaxID=121402 RepID=A0A8T2NTJ0_9TELE|nr:hypothetical protein JZ751_020041 [Albula glossodonta]
MGPWVEPEEKEGKGGKDSRAGWQGFLDGYHGYRETSLCTLPGSSMGLSNGRTCLKLVKHRRSQARVVETRGPRWQ